MTSLLLVLGAVSVVVGIAQIFVPAAFIVGGLLTIMVAFALEPGGERK